MLLDQTFGSIFIGLSFSSFVFGLLTTQVFVYYRNYPSDRLAYRLLVGFVWVLELVCEIFFVHAVYYYVITNYGNVMVFDRPAVWSLILQLTVGSLIGSIVRTCFTLRVWGFSKHNILVTGIIAALVLAECCFVITLTVRAFEPRSLVELFQGQNVRNLLTMTLAVGVAADSFIAFSLCYFLRSFRNASENADSLVNKLMIYTLCTGALTCAMMLLTLILLNACPNTFYFMSSYAVLAKIYSISFVATLTTRNATRVAERRTKSKEKINPDQIIVTITHDTYSSDIYPYGRNDDNHTDVEDGSKDRART